MALLAVAGLLLVLAIVGVLVSAYFTFVTYGWLDPEARWIPRVCRMDERTCARIVDTKYARVFGAPNSLYGIAWYLGVIGLMLTYLTTGTFPACEWLILLAAGVVAFSVFLAWSLIQRLDVHCPLCYTSHALNAAILFGFVALCAAG